MLTQISRNFFMKLSQSKWLNQAAQKWGLRFGASQVVAGNTIESAMQKIGELNGQGLNCTLDHLGEFVTTKEEAVHSTDYNIRTLAAIADTGVKSQLSVKLTQLGLDIDEMFCLKNIRKIVSEAKKRGNFVTIDMEDYAHCQQTLDILTKLRSEYDNVGTVIQSYLHRSEQDIKNLQGVRLRLVKGAYKELATVAYQEKSKIDANLLHLIKQHLLSGSFTAIASHDHMIIEHVKQFVKQQNIPHEQFEFQMLYGFRSELQLKLLQEGYQVRVYVPYGDDWFGYFMRRLAERPQNVAFAFRGFFGK